MELIYFCCWTLYVANGIKCRQLNLIWIFTDTKCCISSINIHQSTWSTWFYFWNTCTVCTSSCNINIDYIWKLKFSILTERWLECLHEMWGLSTPKSTSLSNLQTMCQKNGPSLSMVGEKMTWKHFFLKSSGIYTCPCIVTLFHLG